MISQTSISRDKLRKGFIVGFVYEHRKQIGQGEILHIGLGLAARNAIWVKVVKGVNVGSIECIMLDHVLGVVSYG